MNPFAYFQSKPAAPPLLKTHAYTAAAVTFALLKEPRFLALGAVSAVFINVVAQGTAPSHLRPLAVHMLTALKPVLDQPATTADLCAVAALMMFDHFSPLASVWVGFSATLLTIAHYDIMPVK